MIDNFELNSEYRTHDHSQICRVCLTTNVKMHSLQNYGFHKKFQEMTGIPILPDDKYPGFLCWECAHYLSRYHRFKTRAVLSHYLLTGLLETDQIITEQNVRKINREKNGLVSKLKNCMGQINYVGLEPTEPETEYNEPHDDIEVPVDVFKNEADEYLPEVIKKERLNVKEESDNDFEDDRSLSSVDDEPLINQKLKLEEEKKKVTKSKPTKRKTKPKNETTETNTNRTVKKNASNEYLDTTMFEISDLTLEEQINEVEKRKKSKNYTKSNFKCDKCYKGFSNETSYKSHEIRHTMESGEHECPVCMIRFKTFNAMKHHMTSHVKMYSCKHCEFSTTRRRHAKNHEEFHKGVRHKCPHCIEEFRNSSTYLSHIRIKHPSDIVCELCGYSFVSQKGLDLHKKLKHRFDEVPRPEEDYRCEECGITFLKQDALDTHLNVSPKHAENIKKVERNCRDNRRKDRSIRQMLKKKREQKILDRKKPIQCELCDATLVNGTAYHYHFLREHPGKNKAQFAGQSAHMCEVCGKMFSTQAILDDHRFVHTSERLFKCEICQKSFQRKYALANHISRVHSGKRRILNCEVCGKGFISYNLKRHMLIHTGLKPFECEMCGKFFKDVADRKLHITHVHMKVPWPKKNRPSKAKQKKRPCRPQPKLPSKVSPSQTSSTTDMPLWPEEDQKIMPIEKEPFIA